MHKVAFVTSVCSAITASEHPIIRAARADYRGEHSYELPNPVVHVSAP
jgi:hypothetical protein